MAIAIDRQMRERAKRDSEYLFQVYLSPKFLDNETKKKFRGKAPTEFIWEMSGPMPPECAMQLWKLFHKWIDAKLI